MDEWLEQIAAKYGYNQELKNAISLTIPLMIKKYGEENKKYLTYLKIQEFLQPMI